MDLTPNELQIMSVLWKLNNPLTGSEILKHSVNKTWKDTSLHTLLKSLLAKKAIAEHGFHKDGKAISRTFIAKLSSEDYYTNFFTSYPTEEIPQLFSMLMRRDDINTETIERMEEIIQKLRKELESLDK
ncbi:MAG: BlaI/MecI/CopY family transcriptional regulator [Oscillospiraceae bacterium]|nr:BlaI/MecI/CopY family transcriptional regulator [Oscillospiraceae bacterium]